MPEQNYDLPAWINGSAPAISATNLLKYNNAIKGASTGLDARVAAVEGRVSAGGSGGIGSVDGVSVAEGGNIDLIAGSNMTITPNDAGDTITFASAGGVSGGQDDVWTWEGPLAADIAPFHNDVISRAAGKTLQGIVAAITVPPTGSGATFQVYRTPFATGVEAAVPGAVVTVAAGSQTNVAPGLSVPFAYRDLYHVRLRVPGSTTPGEFATVRLQWA
jgi:hypothetical protein